MRSWKVFYALFAAVVLIQAAAAAAATIDMDDPRRAVGRENDVRVDAQLIQETVSPGTAIGVVYQIQNFGPTPIAVADKVTSATYDEDSSTITLAVGAEVPDDGRMPHLVLIAPGEKKVFRGGAIPALGASAIRASSASIPRYVQVKVTVLRNLDPFRALITTQQPKVAPMLSDAQFDLWFESNETILLNTVPVRFSPRADGSGYSADQRSARSRF